MFTYARIVYEDTICAIVATKGRHTLLERSVKMFMEQERGGYLLIFNNSSIPQNLWKGGKNNILHHFDKTIILINHPLDSVTGLPYTNLGAIYRDALKFVPTQCQIITHWDDDDIFLPSHLSAGMLGMHRARLLSDIRTAQAKLDDKIDEGYKAYKPAKSYFRSAEGINLMGNNLEPSIFVKKDHLELYGYSNTTTEQHLQWLNPLLEKDGIFVDPNGAPTLVYNWGDTEIPTWKTSGDPANPQNFQNYTNFSNDHGDQIITPWSIEQIEPYYDQIEEYVRPNS